MPSLNANTNKSDEVCTVKHTKCREGIDSVATPATSLFTMTFLPMSDLVSLGQQLYHRTAQRGSRNPSRVYFSVRASLIKHRMHDELVNHITENGELKHPFPMGSLSKK